MCIRDSDNAGELEASLEASGKKELLEILRGILPSHVSCIFIRQPKALGLGHAVLCAKPVVNDNPFSVILADDLIDATPPAMQQMAAVYAHKQCSILGVEDVLPAETASYGIVDAVEVEKNLLLLKSIVEKPKPADAPSTLAVVGPVSYTHLVVLAGYWLDIVKSFNQHQDFEIALKTTVEKLQHGSKEVYIMHDVPELFEDDVGVKSAVTSIRGGGMPLYSMTREAHKAAQKVVDGSLNSLSNTGKIKLLDLSLIHI